MNNQPCPWCGNEHIAIMTDWVLGLWVAWGECDNCHAQGPAAFVKDTGVGADEEAIEQAVNKWNLRVRR